MKLRNKKTGEITETNDWNIMLEYNSLAELESEWEDYKGAKKGWYLTCLGTPFDTEFGDDGLSRDLEAIGNHFETEEEAEKTVEKLKAWKRLKDARLKFRDFGYNLEVTSSNLISAEGTICFELMCYEDFAGDLELLFGGED